MNNKSSLGGSYDIRLSSKYMNTLALYYLTMVNKLPFRIGFVKILRLQTITG